MRKLSLIKKIFCAVFATAMLFGSVSCKGKNINSSIKEKTNFTSQKIENYFIAEPIKKESSLSYIEKSGISNGKVYSIGYIMDDGYREKICFINKTTNEVTQVKIPNEIANYDGTKLIKGKIYLIGSSSDYKETYLYEINKDGSVSRTIDFDFKNGGINDFALNENGEIVAIYNETMGSSEKTFINIYDVSGTKIKSVAIDEIIPEYQLDKNIYSVCSNIKIDKNGCIYLVENRNSNTGNDNDSSQIYIFNSDLSYKNTINNMTVSRTHFINMGNENNIFLMEISSQILLVDEVDLLTNEIKGQYEIDNVGTIYGGDSNYDCYFYKEDAIYGYNFASKEEVKVQDLSLENNYAPLNFVDDGDDFFYTTFFDNNQDNKFCIIMNEEGIEETRFSITTQNKGDISNYIINEDGTISFIENAYVNDKKKSYIHTMGIDGSMVSTVELKEFDFSKNMYISSFVKDKDGNFIVSTNHYNETLSENSAFIYKIDFNGKILFEITDKNISHVNDIFILKNGDIILFGNDDKGMAFAKLDFTDKSLDKNYKIEGLNTEDYFDAISGNDEYDLFITRGVSIYGYNNEKKQLVEVLNYIDSDIEGNVQGAFPINKDKIICQIYNYNDQNSDEVQNKNYFLKRADSETLKKVQEKQLLTVAGIYVDYNFSSEIIKFNKSNDKYRAKVIDYSKFNTEDDYNAGSKELSNELLRGNIPDVLLLNRYMNSDIYVNKKMFTDLNDFFSSDKEIKKEDYLENIINIFETEGKLYQIAPSFIIKSMVGKTSELGEKQGWNFKEFTDFIEKNKDKKIFNINERKEMLNLFLGMSFDEYVSFKEGECNFDTENFINLIKLIKEYGNEKDLYVENRGDYYNYVTYANDALLNVENIYGYQVLHEMEKGYIDEPITFKGFPSMNGIGSVISYHISLAISEKSNNKEGAWEFVKIFLKDEFQEKPIETGMDFPIKNLQLKKWRKTLKIHRKI